MPTRKQAANEKTAATLTINGPGAMTAAGRRDVIDWLRHEASRLAIEGKLYTHGRYRASFKYLCD